MKVGIPHLQQRVLYRLSWIPRGGFIPTETLSTFDLRRFQQASLRALQRALPADAMLVGGIDISLNVENNIVQGWQLHVFGLIGVGPDSDARALRTALRNLPVGSDPRPLKIQPGANCDLKQLVSYAMKSTFYKRSRYQYLRDNTGGTTWNTRAQQLGVAHSLQIALLLDRFSMTQRLLLVGLRRVGNVNNFGVHATRDLSSPLNDP